MTFRTCRELHEFDEFRIRVLLILHDDAAREVAYGPARGLPDVKLGAFPPALDEQAKQDGWVVVSMKDDWRQVFPV